MQSDTISDELQRWLDRREEALWLKARIRPDGGHYDPEELEEPLRSEALEFFRYKKLLLN
jgi:hypothetical protein